MKWKKLVVENSKHHQYLQMQDTYVIQTQKEFQRLSNAKIIKKNLHKSMHTYFNLVQAYNTSFGSDKQ